MKMQPLESRPSIKKWPNLSSLLTDFTNNVHYMFFIYLRKIRKIPFETSIFTIITIANQSFKQQCFKKKGFRVLRIYDSVLTK